MVTLVLAEAWSATKPFMEQAAQLFDTQVISQLHTNQQVRFRHQRSSRETYVTHDPGVPQHLSSRGDAAVGVLVSRARRDVDAHHQKRFVIALTDEQETD